MWPLDATWSVLKWTPFTGIVHPLRSWASGSPYLSPRPFPTHTCYSSATSPHLPATAHKGHAATGHVPSQSHRSVLPLNPSIHRHAHPRPHPPAHPSPHPPATPCMRRLASPLGPLLAALSSASSTRPEVMSCCTLPPRSSARCRTQPARASSQRSTHDARSVTKGPSEAGRENGWATAVVVVPAVGGDVPPYRMVLPLPYRPGEEVAAGVELTREEVELAVVVVVGADVGERAPNAAASRLATGVSGRRRRWALTSCSEDTMTSCLYAGLRVNIKQSCSRALGGAALMCDV